MLIAVFDFETTGLDRNQDHVIEVGALLYTTGHKRVVMAEDFLVDQEVPVPKEASNVNKINNPMIDKFGLTSPDGLSRLQNYFDMAEVVVGKNIIDFDLPFYRNWCLREKAEPIERPTIDIETDLIGVENKKLCYMAADDGFLNPFPHAALPDSWTTLRLLENNIEKHGLEKIMQRAASPRVYLQAMVTFDTNYQAKQRKYQWNSDRKVWFKTVKESDVELEAKDAPFDIKRIEPVAR
jgi:DNA polymerase III alpha subunit (gram-positive type)